MITQKNLLLFLASIFLSVIVQANVLFLPAGNRKTAGRKLYQNYERGITFQIARALETELKNKELTTSIFFDQNADQKESISLINKQKPDWIISFGCYKTENLLPIVSLYHLSYDRLREALPLTKSTDDLIFCKELPQIHYKNNTLLSKAVHAELLKNGPGNFQLLEPFFIPCTQLTGLNAPTLLIEIGLNNDNGWQSLVQSLTQAIEAGIKKIEHQTTEGE